MIILHVGVAACDRHGVRVSKVAVSGIGGSHEKFKCAMKMKISAEVPPFLLVGFGFVVSSLTVNKNSLSGWMVCLVNVS